MASLSASLPVRDISISNREERKEASSRMNPAELLLCRLRTEFVSSTAQVVELKTKKDRLMKKLTFFRHLTKEMCNNTDTIIDIFRRNLNKPQKPQDEIVFPKIPRKIKKKIVKREERTTEWYLANYQDRIAQNKIKIKKLEKMNANLLKRIKALQSCIPEADSNNAGIIANFPELIRCPT